MNTSKFNSVLSCEIAKDIWDKVQVTYEGISEVTDTKIDILENEYYSFQMNDVGNNGNLEQK
ncbi:unnamed protein product [Spirodela intermedia]|uniref:Uncharacterized protein n=2 Tax=Spirodela intermedia TaxID=51605 RepID=A0A7I8JLA3_SPIIN|nr:unnamed protein product [Spirodela intermedia]CAA6670575.1 unnamed protein product [Spirodela intermedia]CAA7407649.1 unnamed protein product [Spirodela intermedia]